MNDNKSDYEAMRAFREAMIADGWRVVANYQSEPMESYAKGEKDGWVAHVMARDIEQMRVLFPAAYRSSAPKQRYMCEITIWGPDGLCVNVPPVYSWPELVAGLRRCSSCGATDVQTQRFAFAGRCCATCRPEMARQHEQPGWCD